MAQKSVSALEAISNVTASDLCHGMMILTAVSIGSAGVVVAICLKVRRWWRLRRTSSPPAPLYQVFYRKSKKSDTSSGNSVS